MKNIFVGNLSYQATEESVRAMFEAYGTVDRVSIVTDRDTGQPRGFGFVEMPVNAEGDLYPDDHGHERHQDEERHGDAEGAVAIKTRT